MDLSKLDPMQQITWDSEISANVLGLPTQPDMFLLVPNPVDFASPSLAIAKQRGFAYCGCFGYKAGECKAAIDLSNPSAALTMTHAALEFGKYVHTRLNPPAKDDSLEFLANLWKLEDDRAN